jgi:hypothetical protein
MTLRFSPFSQAGFAAFSIVALLSSCQLPEYAQRWAAANAPAAAGNTTVRRAQAVGDEALYPTAQGFNLPTQSGTLNDTARLLAGLPAAGRDSFPQVRSSSGWVSHQNKLNTLWSDFGWRHEQPIRSWVPTQIADLQAPTLFYPFSGPDFLFAQQFFPNADTVVLCGLEPCEPLPPIAQLAQNEIDGGLDGLVTSISTAMQFSFFITKDMRRDLVSTRFRGVLPLILTFMARTGHTVESIDLVKIDSTGSPVLVSGSSGSAPGAVIRAIGPNGVMKRVFYFRQDLSNDGISPGSPFLRFVASLGHPPAFAKSASYLMHEGGFSVIREFILNNCRGIVQDPSGIPYRSFADRGWNVSLYGNYRGTLDMFAEHNQSDLIAAYQRGNAQPLDFGIGYLYNPERTCLMVGRPGAMRMSAR